jgi:RHS repeat-associated protein
VHCADSIWPSRPESFVLAWSGWSRGHAWPAWLGLMLLACFVLCFPRGITSHNDPEVQFLEVGVTQPDGNRVWKVYGPDGDAGYGGLQGIGGLEALVVESTGTVTPVLGDFFGHVVAQVSGANAVWLDTRPEAYGLLPEGDAAPIFGESGVDLPEATVWQGRRLDPTGLYWMGMRYYDPERGRFLSPDPLGHGESASLYDYAGGDPVNFVDPLGAYAVNMALSRHTTPELFKAYIAGAVSGLRAGLDNINNELTAGLYDRMGWSNSAANVGWEHDLSRSFAAVPRDIAVGAGVSVAYQATARVTSRLFSSLSTLRSTTPSLPSQPQGAFSSLAVENPNAMPTLRIGQDAAKTPAMRAGQVFETDVLAAQNLAKNTGVWRPTAAQIDSAAFKVVVGDARYTSTGLARGTIMDSVQGGFLEIKGGSSVLESTYQLRLQTYRSLIENTPLTIQTARPVGAEFGQWLNRWGVSVQAPPRVP